MLHKSGLGVSLGVSLASSPPPSVMKLMRLWLSYVGGHPLMPRQWPSSSFFSRPGPCAPFSIPERVWAWKDLLEAWTRLQSKQYSSLPAEPCLWALPRMRPKWCFGWTTPPLNHGTTISFLFLWLTLEQSHGSSPHPRPALPAWTLPTISWCCRQLMAWSTSVWAFHFWPVGILAFLQSGQQTLSSLVFSCM